MADQRRQPGEVRDAILEVLRGRRSGAHLSEIHAGVRASLGDVPASSVRSWVGLAAKRGDLHRVGRGRYKLARGRQ